MPSATKAARMTTNDLATEVLPKPTVSAWAIILAQGELGPNPTGPAFQERCAGRFMPSFATVPVLWRTLGFHHGPDASYVPGARLGFTAEAQLVRFLPDRKILTAEIDVCDLIGAG